MWTPAVGRGTLPTTEQPYSAGGSWGLGAGLVPRSLRFCPQTRAVRRGDVGALPVLAGREGQHTRQPTWRRDLRWGAPCGGEPLWTRRGRPFVPFEFSWPLPVPLCVKFSDVMTICTSSDFIVTPARPYL